MLLGRFAAGTKRSISTATGSWQAVGIVAFPLAPVGKILLQFAPATGNDPPSAVIAELQPGLPFKASAVNWSVIPPPSPPLKTPALSCGVGTATVCPETPWRTRRPS